ncbi:MAG: hypothetical protein IJF80_03530 [Clostridia bacterium]|nr:hypothetical protein [Clostridia bacterium]
MKKTLSLVLVMAIISMMFVGCSAVKTGLKFEQTWNGDGTITLTTLADKAGVAFLKSVTLDKGESLKDTDDVVYTGTAAVTIDGKTITFTLPEIDIENSTVKPGASYEGTINSTMTRITLASKTYVLAD